MINNRIVKGSKNTTLHDFEMRTEGMNLIVSKGTYYQGGNVVYSSDEEVVFSVPVKSENTNFILWLTISGFVLNEGYDVVDDLIDRLGWFKVEPNTSNLDAVEINFVKVVEG